MSSQEAPACPHDEVDGRNPNGCVWCGTAKDESQKEKDQEGR